LTGNAERRLHGVVGAGIVGVALVGLGMEVCSPHRYPSEPPEPPPREAKAPASANWQPTATEEQESAAQRHLTTARAHADAKDLTATITELNAIIEKAPNSSLGPNAMYQKGIAYNALGEHRKALDTWRELQTAYPDHRLSIRAERRIGKATYALFRQERVTKRPRQAYNG